MNRHKHSSGLRLPLSSTEKQLKKLTILTPTHGLRWWYI